MGSKSTSKFEVRNPKSRKRTKKKEKSKDFADKINSDGDATETNDRKIDEFHEETVVQKKRRGRKRKTNDKFDDIGTEVVEDNGERNFVNTQQDEGGDVPEDKAILPKKSKKSKLASVTNNEHVDSDQEDTEEGGKNDVKTPKEPSKRQLKRERAEKRENEKREASRLEAINKALNYVSKWKHARSEWKFEKLRQIWLIDNLLDENSIPDDIFPTVLEYFEGCKGIAREQLLKKGMDVIKKAEDDEDNRDEITESVAYKRARKLLQALPTEM